MIMMSIFSALMWYVFKHERLGVYDEIFMLDDEKNRANIMACSFFETFDPQSMKVYLQKKCMDLDRCKSKLVKRLGLWWYLELSDDEWNIQREEIFKVVKDVHTERELNAYMAKQQMIRDPLDTV